MPSHIIVSCLEWNGMVEGGAGLWTGLFPMHQLLLHIVLVRVLYSLFYDFCIWYSLVDCCSSNVSVHVSTDMEKPINEWNCEDVCNFLSLNDFGDHISVFKGK